MIDCNPPHLEEKKTRMECDKLFEMGQRVPVGQPFSQWLRAGGL